MVMGNDSEQNLSKLSVAFDRANTSITRTGQAFGELAKSSQEWNIISRILSGTGMWRLQNQIRAVGNVINVYHNRQEKAMKSTIEAIEANEKLADSLSAVSEALSLSDADIAKTPLAMMFTKAGRDGIAEYKAMWETAGKQLAKAEGGITKSLTPSATSKFLSGNFFADEKGEGGVMNYLQQVKKESLVYRGASRFATGVQKHTTKGMGGLRDFGLKRKKDGTLDKRFKNNSEKMRDRLSKSLGPIAGKITKFFVVGVTFLGKALIGFLAITLGIALLIFIIKKMELGKAFKKLDEKFGGLAIMFGGLKDLFKGFVMMFKGAFTGDGGMLMQGFFKMAKGVGKIIIASLVIAFSLVNALLIGAINGIFKLLGGRDGKIFGRKVPQFASGGVSSGGLAIVGERGPELVRLPSGARVHSNAESRRLAGSNIHVHVNGRVGASDAEIRDIANKVAREINLKMNRTAHTTGRL